MRRRLHTLTGLAGAVLAGIGQAAVEPSLHGLWLGLRRGQQPINYQARARRSHAGKPVGYVKGY